MVEGALGLAAALEGGPEAGAFLASARRALKEAMAGGESALLHLLLARVEETGFLKKKEDRTQTHLQRVSTSLFSRFSFVCWV